MRNMQTPVIYNIASIALKKPDAIAVVYENHHLTYRQLDKHITKISHYLANNYHHNNDATIAIYLEPGVYLPGVLLAGMKAGFACVPLSNEYPMERTRMIIEDACASLIITTKSIYQRDKLAAVEKTVLFLEDLIDLPESVGAGKQPQVTSNNLAYILYTSGSTGIPKGVAIEHGNMSYYLNRFNQDIWPLTRAPLPLTSSLIFAAAITQLYAPLLRGDTLHILPKGILHQYPRLLNWYRRHPGGALYCVPTLWEELLNYIHQRQGIESLPLPQTVFLSGEQVSNDLKNRTFREIPGVRLYNLYGPTEATANSSFSELSPQRPVTIGRALRGSELLIVDENCQSVAPGEPGEICILGDGVARGYLNRAPLTRERFFTVERQGRRCRAYRSGDTGRVLADGEVLCCGRQDRQIKINGIRIEPEEVEQVLQRHAAIAKAIVLRDDSLTSPRLVAWLIAATTERLSSQALRQYLAQQLPAVMIPGSFIWLDAIPKLPNGKLDFGRLPPPSPQRPALSTPWVAAAGELEQEVIDIWQQVLGIDNPGVNDNFFDLGGNSLQLMQVRQRIRQQLYADIDHDCFFTNPTPRLLAGVIPYYCNDEDSSRHSDTTFTGLSSQQHYFLTLEQLSDSPRAYQIYFAIDIQGALNENAVNHSLSRILEQNAILRTRFDPHQDNGFGATTVPATGITLCRHKVRLPDTRPQWDKALLQLAYNDATESEQRALAAFWLLEQAPEHHVLLGRIHHAVFDHDAIAPFFRQFVTCYQAFLAGDTAYRINVPWQYADYCRQQERETTRRHQQGLAFWRQRLTDYRRQGVLPLQQRPLLADGANHLVTLSARLSRQLRRFSRQQQVTPFITLLTLFTLLLRRYTDYRCHPVGIPLSDRTSLENADVIGCFVTMASFFIPINDGDSLQQLLQCGKKQLFLLLENHNLSWQEVMSALRHTPDSALLNFSICFNYMTALPQQHNSNNCEFNVREIYHQQAKLDLTLLIQEGHCLTLCFNYNPDIYPQKKIKYLAQKYCELLSGLSN